VSGHLRHTYRGAASKHPNLERRGPRARSPFEPLAWEPHHYGSHVKHPAQGTHRRAPIIRRDNSRDNKRLAICSQIVSRRGNIAANGHIGQFEPLLDKVEGLVIFMDRGGSNPLGRIVKALLMRAFVIDGVSTLALT
jgi:hypothetical protein